jgi:hypothetical protein
MDVYQENLLNPNDFVMENIHETDNIATVNVKNIGIITVLDMLTGYSGGIRDIETGFRAQGEKDHKLVSKPGEIKRYANFWLSSGNFDIRKFEGTYKEAIDFIKENANTCVGELGKF